ncbi:MAG: SNF2-related protein, partial [Gemmatimonadota bacterium]
MLIADSVGLGKTFIALALIEQAASRGLRPAVIVPASLRRLWRTELRRIAAGEAVQLFSHTQIALGHALRLNAGLIVVDEAHAFRNPRTRRYRALHLLCRPARVVLITATPVNNSLSDLYFQLRLWCSDHAFRDLGIGSLKAALLESPRDRARILRACMIRRTRAEVRGSAERAGFPAHVRTEVIGYQLPIAAAQLGRLLGSLAFAPYRVAQHASAFAPEVLRFGLLKRMESGVAAMRASLSRQICFYEEFIAALERGLLLRPAAFRSLYGARDDALQLVLEAVALEPQRGDQRALAEQARQDLAVLRAWLSGLRSARDDKLEKLLDMLAARPANAKTLVFTEYRDTARALWMTLRRRFRTGLIDGGGAWIGESPAARRQVVECFSPRSSGRPAVPVREAVDVLVATDVLAEGMNLQDADAV